MRTRVKICGITQRRDAEYAIDMGADALGLVFYPPSPRAVSIADAQAIIENLPPFVTIVALFVNEKAATVNQCLTSLSIDRLQFHGDESAAYCEQFNMPYIKAIRMKDNIDLKDIAARYNTSSAILLDSYQQNTPGGTGQVFDWAMIKKIDIPIILAGGLHAHNVATAIRQVAPYAVDVSTGVERSSGSKDPKKISAFMQAVNHG